MKSWLFTIMRNAHHTRYQRDKRSVSGIIGFELLLPTVEPSQEWASRVKEFEAVFKLMPHDRQEAARLVLVEGASYEDAANMVGCAIGTMKSRVSRARTFLAEGLGDTVESAARV
jgi:RNA polymerase sigma-70 factor (ECF subfamily)